MRGAKREFACVSRLPSLCWTCLGWLRIRYLSSVYVRHPPSRSHRSHTHHAESVLWRPFFVLATPGLLPARLCARQSHLRLLHSCGQRQGARVRQEGIINHHSTHNEGTQNDGRPSRPPQLECIPVRCLLHPFQHLRPHCKGQRTRRERWDAAAAATKGLFLGDASFDYLRRGTL